MGGGGCLPQCMLGCTPPRGDTHPRDQTPPDQAPTPWEQTPPPPTRPPGPDTPPGADTPPGPDTPPPWSRQHHTVYERPVCILLECILVIQKVQMVLRITLLTQMIMYQQIFAKYFTFLHTLKYIKIIISQASIVKP